jgi:hypothetical protein
VTDTASTETPAEAKLRNTLNVCLRDLSNALALGSVTCGRLRLLRDGTGPDFSADDREEFLRMLPVAVVRQLLESLPTLAYPWETREMRAGEPVSLRRLGWSGESIAKVRRRNGRWYAWTGGVHVDSPDDAGWPTRDAAMAAADERLIESGVVFSEVTP